MPSSALIETQSCNGSSLAGHGQGFLSGCGGPRQDAAGSKRGNPRVSAPALRQTPSPETERMAAGRADPLLRRDRSPQDLNHSASLSLAFGEEVFAHQQRKGRLGEEGDGIMT